MVILQQRLDFIKGFWHICAKTGGTHENISIRQRETLPLQETDQVAADPAGTLVERWDLERALETLTPQDQELLLLRYANQVPLQALSRLTGLSRFAIYRRCGRLLTQLREALREEERT